VTAQPLSQTNTRLTGRRLAYARLAWGIIALFYLGSFIISLPATLSQRRGFAQQSQGWTEADLRSSLGQLGISFEAYKTYDTWSNLAITIFYFGLGLFIFLRRSDDWMALLFSTLFITFPGTVIFGTLAQTHPAWQTVQALTDSLSSLLIILLFIFPDGRFVPRWTRWVALGYAGIQLWRLFQPHLYQQITFIFIVPLFLCLLLSQIYRYRRVSSPSERQQTKWVVYGLAIGFIPLLIGHGRVLIWQHTVDIQPGVSVPVGYTCHLALAPVGRRRCHPQNPGLWRAHCHISNSLFWHCNSTSSAIYYNQQSKFNNQHCYLNPADRRSFHSFAQPHPARY
jgi:hypothetical protein